MDSDFECHQIFQVKQVFIMKHKTLMKTEKIRDSICPIFLSTKNEQVFTVEENLKVSSKMMNVNNDDLTFPMVLIKEREQSKGFEEYIKEDMSNINFKRLMPSGKH